MVARTQCLPGLRSCQSQNRGPVCWLENQMRIRYSDDFRIVRNHSCWMLDRLLTIERERVFSCSGHFVITELHRLRSYLRKRLQFYFLNTGSDYEVDLVVKRAGAKVQFIEI